MHLTAQSFFIVLPYAVIIALVGLIELLTLSVLDEMDNKHGNGNQECIAQVQVILFMVSLVVWLAV